jgi:hypothetical protein
LLLLLIHARSSYTVFATHSLTHSLKFASFINITARVPHNFPDSPKLAEWQKFQRQQRKLFVKGKHSQLTPERVFMLEKIGFVWEARIDAWESHYVNLRRFKESNGHIYVPVANTVLSQWVKRQRKQYKKYELGQDSSLTSDRVERLNRLGFIWDGRHD